MKILAAQEGGRANSEGKSQELSVTSLLYLSIFHCVEASTVCQCPPVVPELILTGPGHSGGAVQRGALLQQAVRLLRTSGFGWLVI